MYHDTQGHNKIMREWEWERKGQVYWISHFPTLLYLNTFSLSKGFWVWARERQKDNFDHALYRFFQNELTDPHSNLVFPFGFSG